MKKLKASGADQPLASVCCLKCFRALPLLSKMFIWENTITPWTSNFMSLI